MKHIKYAKNIFKLNVYFWVVSCRGRIFDALKNLQWSLYDEISNILLHIHHISRYGQLTITFRIDSTIMIFMCYFWHVLNFRKSSICKHFISPFVLKPIRQRKRTKLPLSTIVIFTTHLKYRIIFKYLQYIFSSLRLPLLLLLLLHKWQCHHVGYSLRIFYVL